VRLGLARAAAAVKPTRAAQLSSAPAATQSTIAHTAALLMPLSSGGMLPPKIARIEVLIEEIGDCAPLICPKPLRKVYAEDALLACLWHCLHVVEKPSLSQMEDQVGAAPLVVGQLGTSEPPLELPPLELPPLELLLDPDICMPVAPPELELPPRVVSPDPLELEAPTAVTPELLEELELPNALTPELLTPPPELELPFPKPSPVLLECSTPLLELEPPLVDPSPPSSAKSSGPPSAKGPT
jgi:hypothetical protein